MIATEADLPFIVDLAREAHQGSVWEDMAAFDAESVVETCRFLMESDNGQVFVCDRGVFLIARFPLWFNSAETVAREVFFYATKGGDALKREAERWAGPGLQVISRHERTDPRLEKLFCRSGYVPIEHDFIRRA